MYSILHECITTLDGLYITPLYANYDLEWRLVGVIRCVLPEPAANSDQCISCGQ